MPQSSTGRKYMEHEWSQGGARTPGRQISTNRILEKMQLGKPFASSSDPFVLSRIAQKNRNVMGKIISFGGK